MVGKLTIQSKVTMLNWTFFFQAIIPDDLVVQTNKGKIRGVTLKSATNKYETLNKESFKDYPFKCVETQTSMKQ